MEKHLHASLTSTPLETLPSPEQMMSYQAKVRQVRNDYMAAAAGRFFVRLGGWVGEVRQIAQSCTAARLHLPAA